MQIARKQLILKADAVACYRPASFQELFAVERIALYLQAIFRSYRLEAGLFTTALDYCLEGAGRTFRPMQPDMVGDGDIEITRAQNCNYALGEGVGAMSIESDVWQLLIRYQVNADRQYRRAVEDYERVKRLRPEVPNQPADPERAPEPENIDDDLASFTERGHSRLDHQSPFAPTPPPTSITPESLAFPKPSPDFTPTAYVHRAAAEPEPSRLKIVPIAPFFPAHSGAFSSVPKPRGVSRKPLGHHEPPPFFAGMPPNRRFPIRGSQQKPQDQTIAIARAQLTFPVHNDSLMASICLAVSQPLYRFVYYLRRCGIGAAACIVFATGALLLYS